jgi:hypothetical protein
VRFCPLICNTGMVLSRIAAKMPKQAPAQVPWTAEELALWRNAWKQSCQMNPGYQLFMQQVEQCSSEKKLYARVLPVMQSSGTGKSRLLNEVAKTVFTFPLCLRPPNANGRFSSVVVTSAADTLSGYPSGDQDVFKLLCQKPADSYDSGFFLAFLLSLFEHAQRAMYINLIFGAVLTSVV